MTTMRKKMDFLSSSEDEDEESTVSALVDSSSDDEPKRAQIKKIRPKTIDDISSALSKVNIDNNDHVRPDVKPRKQSPTTFDRFSMDDSSSDDDSFLEDYKPTFKPTPRKAQVLETSDNQDSATVDRSRSKWRRSVLSKEYSILDSSVSSVPTCRIPSVLFEKMYDHQKEGVAWMVGLHAGGIGGLLADDMGMGKTYQTLAFLGGMMRANTIKNALILAPLSVLPSWEKEANAILKICVSNVCIEVINSECNETRRQHLWQSALECARKRPHLVIMTYGLLASFTTDMSFQTDSWDYIVLDEAQNIKNAKTKVAANVRVIAEAGRETRRLILSGTPIMNNLSELWALMDFACSGTILGPESSFKNRFQRPIEAARDKDAHWSQIEKGKMAAKELQDILKPHLLQRLKVDFLMDKLPSKKDFVIWTHLSKRQRAMYSAYVEAKDGTVMNTIRVKSSPLIAISWLKKLIGHPILVSDENKGAKISSSHSGDLLRDSVKLRVATDMVQSFSKKGHKTLVFSQSTQILDILQRVLKDRVKGIGRIDGKVTGRNRQHVMDYFNQTGTSMDVMLLSTGAGGVGLTLNAADRVILYDPDWNPAADSQAADRCYRIGQTKEVCVYRLISAGTVEEKMYEKQIHKDGIRRAVTSDVEQVIERYYNGHDLRQLFNLGKAGECLLLDRLNEENGRTGGEECPIDHPGIIGISSHGILYDDATLEDNACKGERETQPENPFSSPTKAATLAIMETVATENPSNIHQVMGKSRRILERNTGNEILQVKTLSATADHYGAYATQHDENKNIEFLLKKADHLASSGRREDAIEIMMDGMENSYNTLDRQQKMNLHGKISHLARELGWL